MYKAWISNCQTISNGMIHAFSCAPQETSKRKLWCTNIHYSFWFQQYMFLHQCCRIKTTELLTFFSLSNSAHVRQWSLFLQKQIPCRGWNIRSDRGRGVNISVILKVDCWCNYVPTYNVKFTVQMFSSLEYCSRLQFSVDVVFNCSAK